MPDPRRTQLQLIAVALHVSIAVYGVVPYVVAASDDTWTTGWRLGEGMVGLAAGLGVVAVTNAMIAVMLPLLWPADPSAPRGLVVDLTGLDDRRFQLVLVRMAVAESVALLGLVLAFLARSALVALPFVLVGLVVQVAVGPFGSGQVRDT